MEYLFYCLIWFFITAVFNQVCVEVNGRNNRKLKKKGCILEKKKLSGFQQAFVLEAGMETNKQLFFREGAVYYICYRLTRDSYIIVFVNICTYLIGFILYKTVPTCIRVFEIVHTIIFGLIILAYIIVSIVLFRKAFKSCKDNETMHYIYDKD